MVAVCLSFCAENRMIQIRRAVTAIFSMHSPLFVICFRYKLIDVNRNRLAIIVQQIKIPDKSSHEMKSLFCNDHIVVCNIFILMKSWSSMLRGQFHPLLS